MYCTKTLKEKLGSQMVVAHSLIPLFGKQRHGDLCEFEVSEEKDHKTSPKGSQVVMGLIFKLSFLQLLNPMIFLRAACLHHVKLKLFCLQCLQMALWSCLQELRAASGEPEEGLSLPWVHLAYHHFRTRLQNLSRLLTIHPQVLESLHEAAQTHSLAASEMVGVSPGEGPLGALSECFRVMGLEEGCRAVLKGVGGEEDPTGSQAHSPCSRH